MTREAANQHIVQCMADASRQGQQLILIYFFKETKRELESMIANANHVKWIDGLFPSSVKQTDGNLNNHVILFAETYPDYGLEQAVLKTLEEAGYGKHLITVINGLDDPVFIPFGSEKIKNLMQRLGMKEDEAIEHRMITSSIERAQRKLTDKKLPLTLVNSREEMLRLLK